MANSFKALVSSAITNVVGFFRNTGSAAQSVLAWVIGVRELWPNIDQRTAIEKGYADNTALYSIINKDSAKFASVPRYVYDANSIREGETPMQVQGGAYTALLNLLEQPNPAQSQSEFLELARIYYKACGECFIWLNRGDVSQSYQPPTVDANGNVTDGYWVSNSRDVVDKKPVLQMYLFAPGFVGIVPDPTNMYVPSGYWLEAGGQRRVIHKNDMIHWKRSNPIFDPVDGLHLRGLSPLKVGRRTVQENHDATAAMDRMFKNDGAKGVMVNKNLRWSELEEKQKQAIRDVIDGHINNNDMKGAVATLGGDWQYLDMATSSIDMQLLEGKKFTWQELCFLLDTPYELFDPNTVWANKKEALKWFVGSVIGPACKALDEKFTKSLALAFNLQGKIKIQSDMNCLPEMQTDVAALITSFNNAWYLPPNQMIAALGYKTVANPLFDEPWVPVGKTPLSQISNDAEFTQQQQNADNNPIDNGDGSGID